MNRIQVVLVGDSDIARWPQNLWPCIETSAVSHLGQNGAILKQIVPYVDAALDSVEGSPASKIFIVFCCGENDIAQGIDKAVSRELFASVLNKIMDRRPDLHVIALGPKVEPWMENDKDARLAYCKLSKKFQWECKHHRLFQQITYIDCLTMFCIENEDGEPLQGEDAIPDDLYFAKDNLHLSERGYAMWKEVIEENIQRVLSQTRR